MIVSIKEWRLKKLTEQHRQLVVKRAIRILKQRLMLRASKK
jgi:hypothetical protein